jgi:hypothetical protein
VGYEDDLNLYAYARNDPANLDDPTGLAVAECATGSRIGGSGLGCTDPDWVDPFPGQPASSRQTMPRDDDAPRNEENLTEVQFIRPLLEPMARLGVEAGARPRFRFFANLGMEIARGSEPPVVAATRQPPMCQVGREGCRPASARLQMISPRA